MKPPYAGLNKPIGFAVVLFGLILGGCAQRGAPSGEESPDADAHLPFAGSSDRRGIFPTSALVPAAIPSGTLFSVHLQASLSSATTRPGDSLSAILDEPVIVRGRVVVPRGAVLSGSVLEARPAGPLQDAGYLRLTLTRVSLSGRPFLLHTSTVFMTGRTARPAGLVFCRRTKGKRGLADQSVSRRTRRASHCGPGEPRCRD